MIEHRDLIPSADLHITSLEECVMYLGPQFHYELEVGTNLFTFARQLLRQISADARGNPFAPYVNLRLVPEMKNGAWKISAGGKSIGSPPW